MVDCYHGNTKYGLDILEAYLSEHSRIMESLLNREGTVMGAGFSVAGAEVRIFYEN